MKLDVNRIKLITNTLNKCENGEVPSEIVLEAIFRRDGLDKIKDEYKDEKDIEKWAYEFRSVLSEYEKLLQKGDRAYRSKSSEYGHEDYYERAQAVLLDLERSHPEVHSILRTPGIEGNGTVYGTSLSPENQARFIYSEAEYAAPIKKEKASYLKTLIVYLKQELANEE